ncbi:YdeI/OmpD-associated family protein [Pedobacter deserti]|uniref:YdeI/OmpD-associated family protein n=1 Tax=Pedobacter deserti TaxID=2817382 RepID=UPI00210CECB7|nr:YdeI/OmpD-associated family protein [Pedobacter sp. SYSU D00382]
MAGRQNEYSFKASIEIIGINPYVSVPEEILASLFADAGRDKSPIPIRGAVNGKPYTQTLMKYQGAWRLYINTIMLPDSPKRIGERIAVSVAYDAADRTLPMHPELARALSENAAATAAFNQLSPSLQKEIIRYIAGLKTEQKVQENTRKAVDFLLGKGRFIGRDPKS